MSSLPQREHSPGRSRDAVEELDRAGRRVGYVPRVTALPTAGAHLRGRLIVLAGGAGVADQLRVCLKAAAGTYSWVVVVSG